MAVDLEILRDLFADKRVHIAEALVEKVEVLPDFSKAKVQCRVVPDDYEIIAEVAWGQTGPDSGGGQLPVPKDLVLVAFSDAGNAYVIGRLSSKEDKLPRAVKDGHSVRRSLAGKKAYLESDTKILIGKGGLSDPSEPLVLGNVLKTALGEILTKVDSILTKLVTGPIGMGNLGSPVPTYPQLATDLGAIKTELATLKAQYVDNAATNIVSALAFTER